MTVCTCDFAPGQIIRVNNPRDRVHLDCGKPLPLLAIEKEDDMGVINIEVAGSFPSPFGPNSSQTTKCFSAQAGGHAAAIGRAIAFLSAQLPDAIALDHKLHEQGDRPGEAPFGRSEPCPHPACDFDGHCVTCGDRVPNPDEYCNGGAG